MASHLCRISNMSKEKLQQLLSGHNRKSDTYKCGGCLRTFDTICVLHCHCMKHNQGGSYYFDHVTKTAFPKYDSKCSYAQVNIHESQSDSFERILEANARSINDVSESNHDAFDEELSATASSAVSNKETVMDTEDTEQVLTPVNVRNIAKGVDGLITFEMDEKDAHLFDATATVIMDRISMLGDNWLKFVSDMQVMVPSNGSQLALKTSALPDHLSNVGLSESILDKGAIDENHETSGTDQEFQLGETMTNTEDRTDCGTYKPHTENSEKVGEDANNYCLPSWRHDPVSNSEGIDQCVDGKDVDEEISGIIGSGKEIDLSESLREEKPVPVALFKARPVRNRKPSSRLMSSEWETPVRRKNQKETMSDNKSEDLTEDKADVKQNADKLQNTTIIVNKVAKSKKVNEVAKSSEELVQAEEASSADISASQVLLALSKRGQENVDLDCQIEKKKGMKLRKRKIKEENTECAIEESNYGEKSMCIKTEADLMQNLYSKTESEMIQNDRKTTKVDPSLHHSSTKGTGQVLKRGTKAASQKQKELVCKTCGKVGNKAMIAYHKQAHRKDARFKCDTCGKAFKTKQCFSAHLRQHGERKYKCDQCSAAFFRKQYLDTHKRKHTGEVPYVCDLCGTGFMEYYILQRHINNKHRQERNYVCDVCEERFFRADTRDNHRSRHFEPTLKCAYCSKMFKAELDRRKHELTHTGEKQVFCPICKYGFAQLWPYYRHMWKKHGISKEEAKDIRIKNPDLVYMRNKNTEYQDVGSTERVHKEPIYAVGKRVTKSPSNTLAEVGSERPKYEILDNESANYEFVTSQSGELTQGEYASHSSDVYEVGQHQQLFVDGSDMADGLVMQDGSSLSRNSLVLGDGQSVEATNISIVLDDGTAEGPKNLVILSDYTQTDIEEYAKQYSTVDL